MLTRAMLACVSGAAPPSAGLRRGRAFPCARTALLLGRRVSSSRAVPFACAGLCRFSVRRSIGVATVWRQVRLWRKTCRRNTHAALSLELNQHVFVCAGVVFAMPFSLFPGVLIGLVLLGRLTVFAWRLRGLAKTSRIRNVDTHLYLYSPEAHQARQPQPTHQTRQAQQAQAHQAHQVHRISQRMMHQPSNRSQDGVFVTAFL